MINFRINSDEGVIRLGSIQLAWGNRLESEWGELEGFFCICGNNWSLEFGDIDQGQAGIHLTTWNGYDEITSTKTLITFGGQS